MSQSSVTATGNTSPQWAWEILPHLHCSPARAHKGLADSARLILWACGKSSCPGEQGFYRKMGSKSQTVSLNFWNQSTEWAGEGMSPFQAKTETNKRENTVHISCFSVFLSLFSLYLASY